MNTATQAWSGFFGNIPARGDFLGGEVAGAGCKGVGQSDGRRSGRGEGGTGRWVA
jgi:hypothetical protein